MESKKSKLKTKGQAYLGREREIIFKVLTFFEKEKQNGSPFIPVERAMDRTSEATGVSIRTIRNIKNEAKNIIKNTVITPDSSTDILQVTFPPKPKKKKKSGKELQIDDSDLHGIKNIVESFYQRKDVPTVSKILTVAKKELNFPGQRSCLRKILRQKLGYKFKKNPKNERRWDTCHEEEGPEGGKRELNPSGLVVWVMFGHRLREATIHDLVPTWSKGCPSQFRVAMLRV